LLVHMRRDAFTIRWLMLSVCFVYLLGILGTVAYPSLGPCFLEPERFSFLRGSVAHSQRTLARIYMGSIESVGAGHGVRAVQFSGIAAFPSLHVAHMVIMLVVALRVCKPYAIYMAGIATLTFIATIGFGWHYAVDGIGGILLAAGITYGLGRRMQVWDRARLASQQAG
jgi:hypothetical protein